MKQPTPKLVDPAGAKFSAAAPLFLLLAAAGVPLAFAPGLLLEYEVLPKLLVLLLATAGLLICRQAWYPGLRALTATPRGRLFVLLLCLQVASLLVSTAFAPQPELALAGSGWRRYGAVTQVALAALGLLAASLVAGRPSLLKPVFSGIGAAAGIASIYAILQYAGWDPFLSPSLYTTHYNGEVLRVPATLGHAVYLGAFLAAAIPLMVWLAVDASGARRAGWIAVACLALLALILSGTRSAVLALAAGLAVSSSGLRHLRIRPKFAILAACAGAAILLALLTADFGVSFRLRLTQWRQDFYGGPRLMMWRDTLGLIGRHALLGAGPESFGTGFRRIESAELSRAYPDFFQESPHNFLLAVAVEQGLFGVVAMGGLLALLLTTRTSRDGPCRALKASAVCTFVCLLFLTVTIPGALMLYLAAGWLVALSATKDGLAAAPPGTAISAAALALALALLVAASAYLRQDLAYTEIGSGAPARMLSAFRTLTSMRFPASGDDLWASRQFAARARASAGEDAAQAWTASAAASTRAERTDDNAAAAAFQSALLAIGRNDAAGAEARLRDAVSAAPHWYKPHLLLSQLVRFSGRIAESDAEARLALDLAGESHGVVEKALGGDRRAR